MKRKGRGAWLLVAFLLLMVLLWRLVFVVRGVDIYGNVDASNDAVIRAAKISFGSSLFSVDRSAIREGVNSMGVHELTDIRIRLPNRIALTLEPRNREAMLLYGGKIVVLDENAVVVELADDVPGRDMLYISGLSPTAATPGKTIGVGERQLIACQNVLHALNDCLAEAYVSELNLSDIGNLRLITRSGATVLLGDSSDMNDKIAWMKAVVQDLEKRGEAGGVIDVAGGNKADYKPAGA